MSAPVKHTCPDIDKYIKSIKFCLVKERDLKYMNESELFDCAKNMNDELNYCIEYLEDLRRSNYALREWGEELESRIAELETEITPTTEEELTKHLY